MSKQNTFSGIKMKYDVVQTYRAITDFDHFVFQQMIDDVGVGAFTLAAYAVTKDLKVLNNGNMLPTDESNDQPFTGTKPNIQFANMNLGIAALSALYPVGAAKSDLKILPAGSYYKQNGMETAYVLYVAETGGNGAQLVLSSKVNPSPPA